MANRQTPEHLLYAYRHGNGQLNNGTALFASAYQEICLFIC